jgi:F0F1-type ATP synthase epsilon subunit
MKILFLLAVIFTSVQLFAQTNPEIEVLSISKQIFRQEVDNVSTVAGKGQFNITAAGNNVIGHLSYMEVFIKTKNGWKLFALKASVLPN